jgi:hypothetical protein
MGERRGGVRRRGGVSRARQEEEAGKDRDAQGCPSPLVNLMIFCHHFIKPSPGRRAKRGDLTPALHTISESVLRDRSEIVRTTEGRQWLKIQTV